MFFKRRPILTTFCTIALVIAAILMFPYIRYLIKTTYWLADVGDTVYFGKYEQSGFIENGPDNIEWIVLDKDKDEGKLLLITKKALLHDGYCSWSSHSAWDGSNVRSVLNSEFYDAAFSEREKERIVTTYLEPEQNPYYDTDPGTATEDKVFILSASEAEKYFASDSDRRCIGTWYQESLGSYKRIDQIDWWLRTPGKDTEHIAFVFADGSIRYAGEEHCCRSSLNVRPAIWLSIR